MPRQSLAKAARISLMVAANIKRNCATQKRPAPLAGIVNHFSLPLAMKARAMLAIHESAALRNMADYGLSLESARLALATVKPAARFNGAAYFNPRDIARLCRAGARPIKGN